MSVSCVLGGLGLAVLAACGEPIRRTATLWAWLLAALAATCLVLLASSGLPMRPYGDGAVFAQLVADGRAVPRWLVGSAAAAAAHAALWELPPAAR